MKGVPDEACELLLDRFLVVEEKDTLTELVELLQAVAMGLRFSRVPAYLIGVPTHQQSDTFEQHKSYPILGIRDVQLE
jgi:hypothetical protein